MPHALTRTYMKTCTRCGIPKETSEFPKDASKKDGFYPVCKLCRSPLTRAQYAANRKQIRDRAKAKYAADPGPHRRASKEYREQHADYTKSYAQAYYLEHKEQWGNYAANQDPEKVRQRAAAYREAHREQIRAGVRDWFKRHPHAATLGSTKYRMRRSAVENTLTPAQIEETLEYFGYRCGYCLVDLLTLPESQRTLDHITPIVRGGSNTQDNVIPCCKSCNSRKGSRPVFLMARYTSPLFVLL